MARGYFLQPMSRNAMVDSRISGCFRCCADQIYVISTIFVPYQRGNSPEVFIFLANLLCSLG